MYNILLIYQIGVDVSTHPMVLSVPVQFSLHTQTHTSTLMKLYRDAHARASKWANALTKYTFHAIKRVRMRARAMLVSDFHFSFF